MTSLRRLRTSQRQTAFSCLAAICSIETQGHFCSVRHHRALHTDISRIAGHFQNRHDTIFERRFLSEGADKTLCCRRRGNDRIQLESVPIAACRSEHQFRVLRLESTVIRTFRHLYQKASRLQREPITCGKRQEGHASCQLDLYPSNPGEPEAYRESHVWRGILLSRTRFTGEEKPNQKEQEHNDCKNGAPRHRRSILGDLNGLALIRAAVRQQGCELFRNRVVVLAKRWDIDASCQQLTEPLNGGVTAECPKACGFVPGIKFQPRQNRQHADATAPVIIAYSCIKKFFEIWVMRVEDRGCGHRGLHCLGVDRTVQPIQCPTGHRIRIRLVQGLYTSRGLNRLTQISQTLQ